MRAEVPRRPVSSAMAEKVKSETATGMRTAAPGPGANQAANSNGNLGLDELIRGAGRLQPGVQPDIYPGADDIKQVITRCARSRDDERKKPKKAPPFGGEREHEYKHYREETGSSQIPLTDQQDADQRDHHQSREDGCQD